MAFSVSAAWMLLWVEVLEAEELSPDELYFGSKLQSLKNDILTFFLVFFTLVLKMRSVTLNPGHY